MYADAVAAYGSALGRLGRGYEVDGERRRDLLQDIHLALWQSLDRFDGRCSLRTWTYRVAHNLAISKVIRRRTRMPTLVSVDELELRAESGDREDQFDRARASARLLAVIHELKPLAREGCGCDLAPHLDPAPPVATRAPGTLPRPDGVPSTAERFVT